MVFGILLQKEQRMSEKNIFHQHIIRNVWAAGKNYVKHAQEMKSEPPKEPIIFLKSGNCVTSGSLLHLPPWSNEIHHEIEFAFWIDEELKISHITLALDLTLRDAQTYAKQNGMPWTLAKCFIGSCPIGHWIPVESIPNLDTLQMELKINNETRQLGNFSDMIFKPQVLLNYIKKHFPVAAYDVILTGTPAGVGPLKSGDKLEAVLRDKSLGPDQPLLVCHWDVN